jgi:hypothetical protein
MGHSHIGVTADTYVHLALDSQIAAARRMEEALFAEQPELCSNCAQPSAAPN